MESLFWNVLVLIGLLLVVRFFFRAYMNTMPGGFERSLGRRIGRRGGGGGGLIGGVLGWMISTAFGLAMLVLQTAGWLVLQAGRALGLVSQSALANYTANKTQRREQEEADHFRRWQDEIRGGPNGDEER